jgi:hypothetical protein
MSCSKDRIRVRVAVALLTNGKKFKLALCVFPIVDILSNTQYVPVSHAHTV